MKKVIYGKLYNTDTADFLCNFSNNRLKGYATDVYPNSYGYHSISIYRNKSGDYFIEFEGQCIGYRTLPEVHVFVELEQRRIITITECEAKVMVEKYFDGDEYIAIFGEVAE